MIIDNLNAPKAITDLLDSLSASAPFKFQGNFYSKGSPSQIIETLQTQKDSIEKSASKTLGFSATLKSLEELSEDTTIIIKRIENDAWSGTLFIESDNIVGLILGRIG